MLDNLNKYHIILASKSPRRRELLAQLCIPFEVRVADVKEVYPDTLEVHEIAPFLSQLKGDAFRKEMHPGDLVISADTLVICDGEAIGKPRDKEDAKRMLSFLSGKVHEVVSGVSITTAERRETFSVTTRVKFGSLSPEEIDWYVARFSPLDKAGAYGIQEWIGAVAVEFIEGSFYNVMGLPVHQLYKALKRF